MIRLLLVLAAFGASAPAAAADLYDARALVEQRRYAEAIAVYDGLLAEPSPNADLLIEAARVNAWADRHAAAAGLYRRAIEAAPQRRDDVLLPLAWQLAWRGAHAEAMPLFREVADSIPGQRSEARHGLAESLAAGNRLAEALAVYRTLAAPADIKARHGEARMLLWLERHDEAAAVYRVLLASDPDDRAARIGLARALNHDGRHFAAVSTYAAAVSGQTALANETRVERATALRWSGLEDASLATLGNAAGRDADELRHLLTREVASSVRGEIETAWDSDELEIHALGVGWQQRFSEGRMADVAARSVRLEQNGQRTNGHQLMLKAGTRLGNIEDGLFWPALSLGVRDYDGWQTAAWKLQGKWVPADFWRIDIEAGNEVIENIESIDNRVTLNALSAGVDWRLAPRWGATLGAAVLRFDDGNQRTRLISRVEHVVTTAQPRIVIGLEGMGFRDSDPTVARGYYNPKRYGEFKALVRGEHQAAGWLLNARLALGKLWETPGNSSGLYAWELSAARDLAHALRLRLYAGGSDSSTFASGGSGYTRNYLGASLIWFH